MVIEGGYDQGIKPEPQTIPTGKLTNVLNLKPIKWYYMTRPNQKSKIFADEDVANRKANKTQ